MGRPRRPAAARAAAAAVAGAAAAAVAGLAGCGADGDSTADGSLTVLAASSLAPVMGDLGDAFAARHPGVALRPRYGGSPALARQVVDGAPADLLITADRASMDQAAAAVGPPVLIARNRLAIAVPAGNPGGITGLADLAGGGLRVVVCAPEVPCGRLAAALLGRAGVTLRPASLEQDVRAVLAKVSLGEADAGIVYATDARPGSRGVERVPIAEAAAADLQAVYLAAVVRDGGGGPARDLLAFLQSAEARRIFERHGFARP